MKKRNKIIIITIIVVFLLIVAGLIFQNKKEEIENKTENEIDIEDEKIINEIKNEINATGDTDIYQIEEEYDGRQILQVKPSIQFETALAGILKKGIPQENEVSNLVQEKPMQKGIWISENSRERFLTILKENDMHAYAINEQGYVYTTEEREEPKAKILNTAIHSDKLYIIDVSGTSYVRDEFSGEISEYPFEKMDPYQAVDSYESDNQIILQITTNTAGKLSNQEILKEILLNLEN